MRVLSDALFIYVRDRPSVRSRCWRDYEKLAVAVTERNNDPDNTYGKLENPGRDRSDPADHRCGEMEEDHLPAGNGNLYNQSPDI